MKRPWAARSGFTIVELIVAMIVIGIIAGIVVVGYNSVQRGARDTERDGHIATLKVALQKYYADHSQYPDVCPGGAGSPCPAGELANELDPYLDTMPHDPSHAEDSEEDYQYILGPDGSSYGLKVTYETRDTCKTGKGIVTTWWDEDIPACENEAASAPELQGIVTTLAGSTGGFADGTGSAAQFYLPYDTAVGPSGEMYVADLLNDRIRKVTTGGVVTTFAGSGTDGTADGTGTAAQFTYPTGVAVDPSGNVYVSDTMAYKIRKITPAGVVTTFAGSTNGTADGTGTAAQFGQVYDLDTDSAGNVYVADAANRRIRKITPAGVVTTLAGSTSGYEDGVGTAAKFGTIFGIAVGSDGYIYVADTTNNRIRKISPAGVVTTLAGSTQGSADGTGTAAQFYQPYGVDLDEAGNIYVADAANHRVRKVTPAGVVTTLAGSTQGSADGTGTAAQFYSLAKVTVHPSGRLYVTDTGNSRIRVIE